MITKSIEILDEQKLKSEDFRIPQIRIFASINYENMMAQIILRFLCAVSVNPLSLIFSVTLFLRLFLILMLSFSLSELFNLKFIRTILTFSPSVSRSRPHWLVKIGSAILLNLLTQAKQPIILPKKKSSVKDSYSSEC